MRNRDKFSLRSVKQKPVYGGLVLLLIAGAFVLGSCAGGGEGGTSGGETTSETHNMGGMTGMEHGEKGMPGMQGMAMEMPTVDPQTAGLTVNLQSDPAHPRPEQSTALRYLITTALCSDIEP